MHTQRTLLKLMLWLLAAAALAAVAGVFTDFRFFDEHIIGTCVVAAITAGLMMPLSKMIDREESRLAGLIGMTALVIEFLLILGAIWEVFWRVGLRNELYETAGGWALTGLAATVCVRLLSTRGGKAAGWVGLAAVGLMTVAWMTAAWAPLHLWQPPGVYSYHQSASLWESLWATALVFGGYGVLATACLIGQGVDRRYWRWIGLLAAIATIPWLLTHIWPKTASQTNPSVTIWLTSTAVAVAYVNLMLYYPARGAQIWLRRGAITSMLLSAACLDMLAWIDWDRFWTSSSWFWAADPFTQTLARLTVAGLILAVCAVLAMIVMARLYRGVNYEPGAASVLLNVKLFCPRCGKKQTLPIGDAACSDCGLRVHTQVEEPRCTKCGYLLYLLTGPTCPECGTAIEPQKADKPMAPDPIARGA